MRDAVELPLLKQKRKPDGRANAQELVFEETSGRAFLEVQ